MRIPPRQKNLAVAKIKRKENGAEAHLNLGLAKNRDDLPYRHTPFHPLSVVHRGQDHLKRVEPGAFVGGIEQIGTAYRVLLQQARGEDVPLLLAEMDRRDDTYAE